MDRTACLDRTVARKLDMNSPDFEEANMFIFEGTPEECWKVIRDTNRLVRNLGNRRVSPEPRLRRSVAKKYFRNENGELIDMR